MYEILSGPNTILESLRASRRRVRKLYLSRGRGGDKIREILRLAEEKGVAIAWVERNELSSLCKHNRHQGIAALVDGQRFHGLDEVLEEVRGKAEAPLFLVLDEIQDSGNMGSILRTAENAGVDAVIIPKDRSAKLGPGAAKSSAGAEEYVKVIMVTNLAEAMRRMREAGIWLVGAEQAAERVYYEADLRGPVALVLGGEGEGLRRLTKENCDILVRIPMMGQISCLNAAVAAGILTFEIVRQRAKKEKKER
jgi:23S rRNA (guanosine2251-2'-O)-methyltransferase